MVRDGESYIKMVFFGVPPFVANPICWKLFHVTQESLNDTNAYYRRICHVFCGGLGGDVEMNVMLLNGDTRGKLAENHRISWDFIGKS